MKKLVTLLSLAATTAFLHAQGVVVFNSANLGILTNTATSVLAGGTGTGGVSGKTGTGAANNGAYLYQLFIQTYTGTTPADNPLAANGWSVATVSGSTTPITGVNGTAGPQSGSILGTGGAAGVAVNSWALPSTSNYSDAGENYFMIAGWSSSLGTSWSAVSGLLADNFANAVTPGYFGLSVVGTSFAGGANSLTAQSLFAASGQTIVPAGAFSLYYIPAIPEPTTIALAGLGGLSLLLFRRRK